MKACLFFLFIMGLQVIPVYAATYTVTEQQATPLDNPAGATTVVWENTNTSYPDDDDKRLVNIGFPFRFGSTDYTQLRIHTNGLLDFGADQALHRIYTNQALPTSVADRFIAVYWDDMVDNNQSDVTYGLIGSAPDRAFVVTWTNLKAYSNNKRYDFQVVLYENGNIRFRYDNNTANGESATIGIEVDDSDYTQYSYNNTSVETTFDLLFSNNLLAPPAPVMDWHFDESSWTGATNEVLDSSTNALHGSVYNGALNENLAPAIDGIYGTCRYGHFDGADDYIEVEDNNLLDLSGSFTVAAWVNIDTLPSSGLKSIVSKDENVEFHINSSGQVFWWWQDASGTRSLTSSSAVTPGQWHHVLVRFTPGAQTLFVDGLVSATANYPLSTITNSDPFQVGSDQNFGGRYFNGLIDEVYVSDQALTDLQVLNLRARTRPCGAGVTAGCGSRFPDGASSHNGGTMTFGYNAQLYFSPDNQLDFSNVVVNGGSTVASCVTADCSASGSSVAPIPLPVFPSTSFTNSLTVNTNGTGTIGNAGSNEYGNVRVKNRGTLNVSSNFDTYYIDSLDLGTRAQINLIAGDYWISTLTIGNQARINVTGGTARLFVLNDLSIGSSSLINSPATDSAGDAAELLIVGYGNVTMLSNSTTSAIVYAQGDILMESPSYLYGAATADNITLNSDATIDYQSTAVDNIDYSTLCAGSCTLGSFSVVQPAYALACPQTRAGITITAICDDGISVKDDYSGTVTISGPATSTFYDAATAGNVISSYTFSAADNGVYTAYLYFNNEDPDVRVIVNDATAGLQSTALQGTDFRALGFAVSDGGSVACGTDTSITLTAYGRTQELPGQECEVITGFNGSKAIKAWYEMDIDGDGAADPVTTNMVIDGVAVSDQLEPTSTNINLDFTAGQASFAINYANAGKLNSLNFLHDEAPYDGVTFGNLSAAVSSGSVVFYPSQFLLEASTSGTALNNTSSSGGVTHAAGVDFNLQLTAQCFGGGTATDYLPGSATSLGAYVQRAGPTSGGAEGQLRVSNAVTITSSLSAPVSGGYPAMGVDASSFSSGVYSYSLADYSEVGLINLFVQDKGYFGITNVGTSSISIGRFVPDHFAFSQISSGEFENSCASSSSAFTYNGEPFSYSPGLLPAVKITPRNADNQTTNNYIGAYRKLVSPAMVSRPSALVSANPGVDSSNLSVAANYQVATLSNNGSSIDFTFNSSDTFTYQRVANAMVAPFAVSLGLIIDGVNDGEASGFEVSSSFTVTPAGSAQQYYGRLNTENAFGPETDNLPYPVTTEYWDGVDFVLNTDDDCSAISAAQITTSPVGSGGLTGIAVGTGTSDLNRDASFTDGDGHYLFTAPGAGNTGTILVDFDLTSYPWLQFDWNQDGSDDNPPTSSVIFGQYRGHDKVIYWREVTY